MVTKSDVATGSMSKCDRFLRLLARSGTSGDPVPAWICDCTPAGDVSWRGIGGTIHGPAAGFDPGVTSLDRVLAWSPMEELVPTEVG